MIFQTGQPTISINVENWPPGYQQFLFYFEKLNSRNNKY